MPQIREQTAPGVTAPLAGTLLPNATTSSAGAVVLPSTNGVAGRFVDQSAAKTASYALGSWHSAHYITTGGAIAQPLPTGAVAGDRVRATLDAGTNAVSFTYGGNTITSLATATHSVTLEFTGTTWERAVSDKPQASEDARYLTAVNIKAYGAVGDWNGTTGADNTNALQAAIDACSAAGGGCVFLPKGRYKSGPLALPTNVRLRGEGPGASQLIISQTSGVFLTWQGTIPTFSSPTTTLTSSTVVGDTTLALGSTNGLAAGDVMVLGSQAIIPGETTARVGEMVEILSVDSSTAITIKGVIRQAYLISDAAAVYKMSMVEDVGFSSLGIVNPNPASTTTQPTLFFNARNVACSDFMIDGADGPGIGLRNVYGGIVSSFHVRNFSDSDANGRYGYGVMVERATEGVEIANGTATKVRHAFTTSSFANQCGAPSRITVSNVTATSTTKAAFDTHPAGRDITLTGCTAQSTSSSGFQIRSSETRLKSCTAAYTKSAGITIVGTSGNLLSGIELNNCTVRHITNNHGVQINYVDGGSMQGCDIEGIWNNGINFDGTVNRFMVLKNRIANVGQTSAGQGIQFQSTCTGTSNVILDNTFVNSAATAAAETGIAPGQTRYGVYVTSGMTSTYVADNKGIGLVSGMVSDSGTGTIKSYNRQLDKVEAASFLNGVTTLVKSGAPADTDFGVTPGDGTLVVDTASLKLWSRFGGTWIGSPSSYETLAPNLITTGQETIVRDSIIATNLALTSGTVEFTYFTARKSETSTQVNVFTGGTAAAATPTLCRVGLYTVDASKNLTLVASTANDTTLFNSANNTFTRSWSSSYNMAAGQRYAIGILVVSAATMPQMIGNGVIPNVLTSQKNPIIATKLASQTDLPSSATNASLAASQHRNYTEIVP